MSAKESNPEASDQELKEMVEKLVTEQGFSKSGLALRLKQLQGKSELNNEEEDTQNRLPH